MHESDKIMLLVATSPLSEYAKQIHQVVKYLGLGDFDLGLDIPPSCPTTQPVLPNSDLPKQNRANSGMTEIKDRNHNQPNPGA